MCVSVGFVCLPASRPHTSRHLLHGGDTSGQHLPFPCLYHGITTSVCQVWHDPSPHTGTCLHPNQRNNSQPLLYSYSAPKERLQVVLAACSPVEAMLRDAIQYRQTKSSLYSSHLSPDSFSLPLFLPWTGEYTHTVTEHMVQCLSTLISGHLTLALL